MIRFVFCVVCAIFLNTSLAITLGISSVATTAFLPFMLLLSNEIFFKKIDFSDYKKEIRIILLAILIVLFKFVLGQNYIKGVAMLLIVPMLISIYLDKVSIEKLKAVAITIEVFYVLECVIAVYEKYAHTNLFYTPFYNVRGKLKLYQVESWEFRSSALLGHPLANAMVVAVILTLIVVNKNISERKKYIYVFLGCTGLLSFNSRGALLVVGLFVIPYFCFDQLKNKHIKHKVILLLAGLIVIVSSGYYITNSDLGGRLVVQDKLIDGSAQTRLDVFRFYKFLSAPDLLYGSPNNYQYLTKKLRAGGVENGVVVYIINYGLIFTPFLLYFLFSYQNAKLKYFSKKERLLVLLVFYLIGVMNPNLMTSVQWVIFIFAFYGHKYYQVKSQ